MRKLKLNVLPYWWDTLYKARTCINYKARRVVSSISFLLHCFQKNDAKNFFGWMVRRIDTILENFSGSQKNFFNCEIHSLSLFILQIFICIKRKWERILRITFKIQISGSASNPKYSLDHWSPVWIQPTKNKHNFRKKGFRN